MQELQRLDMNVRKRLLDRALYTGERISFSTGRGVFNYPITPCGKPENISLSLQAQDFGGGVPQHYHLDLCEALVRLIDSDQQGDIFHIPLEKEPVSYTGIGADVLCHKWPDNLVLALSVKGADFESVKKYLSNLSYQAALLKALKTFAK